MCKENKSFIFICHDNSAVTKIQILNIVQESLTDRSMNENKMMKPRKYSKVDVITL